MEEVKSIVEMLKEPEEKIEETKTEEVKVEEPKPEAVVSEKTEEPEKLDIKEELSEKTEEPENTTSSAETEEKPLDAVEQPKRKYADKFETPEDMEKAYKDLQVAFSKKSMAVSEKVKETESLMDEREFEGKIAAEIETKAIDLINKTYGTITDPEIRKKAAEMLMSYNTTGNIDFIEAYYNCLEPNVDRQLQKQLTQVSLETRQSYASRRNEIMYEPVKKELLEIEAEDPEFIKDNSDILVQVIKSNPKTSVKEIRSLIKQVEERAIENYKKSVKTQPKVEKSAIAPVSKAPAPKPEDKPKKPIWTMSVKEMLEQE